MGKDREGKFHPKKGKPSGGVESMERNPSNDTGMEEVQQDLTNAQIMHPNRNTNKKHDYKKEQTDNQSDKTINETYTEEFVQTIPQELKVKMDREQFAALAGFKSDHCLTVYLPTHRKGMEVNEQQDLIAFKNVLQEAAGLFASKGAGELQIKRMLKPGYDLLREDEFWYNLSDTLACFIAEGRFEYIRLPFTVKQDMLLNTSFMVSPLTRLFMQPEYFYVLLMSKKQAKLYRADAWGIELIDIPELPRGVEDVVHFEEKDDQKLFRAGTGGGTGGANFHGIGSGKPDDKKNIEMYLDEVDETLWKELLNNEHVPLLLAGIEYMIPIYKSVTQYRYLWNEHLAHGGLEHEHEEVLYRMAMEKMQPYFLERKEKALRMYANQSASALTASVVDDIIPAVYYGQVSHLFVREGSHVWGSFNVETNELVIHAAQEADDDCLVDKATTKALAMGGEVFLLPADEMPAATELAAVLRYSSQSDSEYRGSANDNQ
jgi:hypothetical protein